MQIPRLSPKGIREIIYPSDNIIQRFSSKDYSGEITLENASGQWVFNPPIGVDQLDGIDTYIETVVNNAISELSTIDEAPIDGNQYARKDAAWEIVEASSVTKNQIDVTIEQGGYLPGDTVAVGTEFETILSTMLSPYQTSKLNTFTVGLTPAPNQGVVYEVGATITIGSGTFTYSNDSNNVPPKDFVITGTGFSGTFQASPIVSNGTTYQYITPSTQNWTLSAKNAQDAATNTLSFSRSSQWRIFFGALSTFSMSNMQQSKLNSNQVTTWTATADNANAANFTYIAYPSTFPDLSGIIMNGAAPVLGAFTKQADTSYTNAYGIVQTYKVYKSNATGAFAATDTLALS